MRHTPRRGRVALATAGESPALLLLDSRGTALDSESLSICAGRDASVPLKQRAEESYVLIADGVADLLNRDAVGAHDRNGRVPSLMGVPMADACTPGYLAEPPVERVAAVLTPVLIAEDEVGVVPCLAGLEPLGVLALPMHLEGIDGASG